MQSYRIENSDINENGYLINQYPEEIQGNFNCDFTKLKFLKGVPKKINGLFSCYGTPITSLIDGPQWVSKSYNCSDTPITSLESAPQWVGESFWCNRTQISSLQGIGRKLLKHIGEGLEISNCPIKSHILGILLIKDLKYVFFDNMLPIQDIINKHLRGERDVLEFQEELINNGFKEYAKL